MGLSLQHLTLNTGSAANLPRIAAPPECLALVQTGGGPVPGFAPWRCVVTRGPGAASFDLRRSDQEVAVLCIVCWSPRESQAAWQALEEVYLRIADAMSQAGWAELQMPERPEVFPWLGVILLPAMFMAAQTDLSWMGNFERCLAWAIIESENL